MLSVRVVCALAFLFLSPSVKADSINILFGEFPPERFSFEGSASVSSVDWVGTTLDFSHTTFELNFPDFVGRYTLPSLRDIGIAGRLDSIDFELNNRTQYRIFHNFEVLELSEGQLGPFWQTHGVYTFTGKLNVFSNDSLIGLREFSLSTFLACSGSANTICVIEETLDSGTTSFTELNPGDRQIDVIYSDMKLVGSLNDDRGTFGSSDYSADWTLTDPLHISYNFTPLSEVPIPGALPLLLSALAGLGLLSWRRRAPTAPAALPLPAASRRAGSSNWHPAPGSHR